MSNKVVAVMVVISKLVQCQSSGSDGGDIEAGTVSNKVVAVMVVISKLVQCLTEPGHSSEGDTITAVPISPCQSDRARTQ